MNIQEVTLTFEHEGAHKRRPSFTSDVLNFLEHTEYNPRELQTPPEYNMAITVNRPGTKMTFEFQDVESPDIPAAHFDLYLGQLGTDLWLNYIQYKWSRGHGGLAATQIFEKNTGVIHSELAENLYNELKAHGLKTDSATRALEHFFIKMMTDYYWDYVPRAWGADYPPRKPSYHPPQSQA